MAQHITQRGPKRDAKGLNPKSEKHSPIAGNFSTNLSVVILIVILNPLLRNIVPHQTQQNHITDK